MRQRIRTENVCPGRKHDDRENINQREADRAEFASNLPDTNTKTPRRSAMCVQIRAKNFRIPDTACEEMERRIRFALSRFVGRISLVTVTLADSNGPRGASTNNATSSSG